MTNNYYYWVGWVGQSNFAS